MLDEIFVYIIVKNLRIGDGVFVCFIIRALLIGQLAAGYIQLEFGYFVCIKFFDDGRIILLIDRLIHIDNGKNANKNEYRN